MPTQPTQKETTTATNEVKDAPDNPKNDPQQQAQPTFGESLRRVVGINEGNSGFENIARLLAVAMVGYKTGYAMQSNPLMDAAKDDYQARLENFKALRNAQIQQRQRKQDAGIAANADAQKLEANINQWKKNHLKQEGETDAEYNERAAKANENAGNVGMAAIQKSMQQAGFDHDFQSKLRDQKFASTMADKNHLNKLDEMAAQAGISKDIMNLQYGLNEKSATNQRVWQTAERLSSQDFQKEQASQAVKDHIKELTVQSGLNWDNTQKQMTLKDAMDDANRIEEYQHDFGMLEATTKAAIQQIVSEKKLNTEQQITLTKWIAENEVIVRKSALAKAGTTDTARKVKMITDTIESLTGSAANVVNALPLP
jgi:hypothetical protein